MARPLLFQCGALCRSALNHWKAQPLVATSAAAMPGPAMTVSVLPGAAAAAGCLLPAAVTAAAAQGIARLNSQLCAAPLAPSPPLAALSLCCPANAAAAGPPCEGGSPELKRRGSGGRRGHGTRHQPRLVWSPAMHTDFEQAVSHCGECAPWLLVWLALSLPRTALLPPACSLPGHCAHSYASTCAPAPGHGAPRFTCSRQVHCCGAVCMCLVARSGPGGLRGWAAVHAKPLIEAQRLPCFTSALQEPAGPQLRSR